jgi:hypothetical protein
MKLWKKWRTHHVRNILKQGQEDNDQPPEQEINQNYWALTILYTSLLPRSSYSTCYPNIFHQTKIVIIFYGAINWGSERTNNLHKVTYPVIGIIFPFLTHGSCSTFICHIKICKWDLESLSEIIIDLTQSIII